jgi:2,4-dienoyl-CoA reductase-like NADH-dependent reductase (Old Yellow Enzyme family)
MSRMFESTEINGMKMANRFVRSATWEGLADGKGAVTPRLLAMISELALGDIGLIISSHAYVREDGKAGPGQIGIYKDELIQPQADRKADPGPLRCGGFCQVPQAANDRGGDRRDH